MTQYLSIYFVIFLKDLNFMKQIQYIIHADFEMPGIIETWAKRNHFSESFCRPFVGDKVPDPASFDLLIVMGGPQSYLNVQQAPYLKEEVKLIQKTLERGMPILGFCLGAQLIGEALGVKTERSPNKEVGVFPIKLSDEGLKDPILKMLPSEFLVIHWHNDMPGLTVDAKVLASSEGCPRQIVRYLPNVYGFQCHLEQMKSNIEAMIENCPEDLSEGRFVQSKDVLLANDYTSINKTMESILNSFIYLNQKALK
jgi:GMP synthase (glutamine-hydrolysing)